MQWKTSLLFITAISCNLVATPIDQQKGQFELLPLPYSYEALEPSIDARTMHLHHDKHHQAYVDNLNKAVKGTEWDKNTLPELFKKASLLPTAVRNNAGGHWNHTFYWSCMTPDAKKNQISDRLKEVLIQTFGSIETFKEKFRDAGLSRFGSGYAWLIRTPKGELLICSSPNQDNPLMDDCPTPGKPLLVADVWEHAYYLLYQNRRGDYLDSFWKVANWNQVDQLYFQEKSTH